MSALQQRTASGDGLVGRPNVVAFVAPTTIRFLVLIGALLSAGLFMGTWLHNESPVGDDWARRVAECQPNRSSRPSGDWLAQVQARQQCTASVERRRFAFALGGACLTLLAGIGVVLAAPRVIERRRGLHPVGPRLTPAVDKFQVLAHEAGVVGRPALVTGSARLRDAFSYGIPGRYRVAVAPAALVRWRDSTTFDPLIRHELAHLRHHDVPLAWMARSMWVVVVPLLTLPIVWGLLSKDPSAIPSYLWRAALLTIVTLLASSALLRSREHDADLRASATPDSAVELRTLLHRISTPTRAGVRKLLAYHPSGDDRVSIVDSPARHAAVTFVDGLTAAFLAGLTLPLLIGVVSTVSGELAFVVAGMLVGPLLGATVGLGLWRQSLVQRVTGGHVNVAPVALGVLIGCALGLAVSLAQTGSESVGEYNHLMVNALTPVAVCGATVIAAGLGELFADAASRFRTPRVGWVSCIVLVGTLFAVTLWAATTLGLALDQGGWSLGRAALMTVLSARGPAIVALALAITSACALLMTRANAIAPHWSVVGQFRPPWPAPAKPRILGILAAGIVAGTIGTLTIIGFRILAGPAAGGEAEQLARADLHIWQMAAVGAGAALALVVLQPARGLGTALLASPVASGTAAIGFLTMNTALGGDLNFAFIEQFIRRSLALGLLCTVPIAVASLVLRAAPTYTVRNTLAVVVLAGVLAGLASLGVVAARQALLISPSSPIPRAVYADVVAKPLLDGREATAAAWRALQAERPPNEVAANRIRTEILPVLQQMLDGAESVPIDDPEVWEVHEHAIKGARSHVMGFEKIASALEQNDRDLLQEGDALLREGNAEWEEWAIGTENL